MVFTSLSKRLPFENFLKKLPVGEFDAWPSFESTIYIFTFSLDSKHKCPNSDPDLVTRLTPLMMEEGKDVKYIRLAMDINCLLLEKVLQGVWW